MSCTDSINRKYGDQLSHADILHNTDKVIIIQGQHLNIITLQELANFLNIGSGSGLQFVSTINSSTISFNGDGTPSNRLTANFIGTLPTYNLQQITDNGNSTNKVILLTVDDFNITQEGLNFQYTHDHFNTGNEAIIISGNANTNNYKPLTIISGKATLTSNGQLLISSNTSTATISGVGINLSSTAGDITFQTNSLFNIVLKNNTIIEQVLNVGTLLSTGSIVANFNGRTTGFPGVNSNEYIVKSQLDSYSPATFTNSYFDI